MSFSENLVKLQQEHGVTNYRLAKEVGVHASTVRNWIDGVAPRLEHAHKVAAYFGKTVDEMMLCPPSPKE